MADALLKRKRICSQQGYRWLCISQYHDVQSSSELKRSHVWQVLQMLAAFCASQHSRLYVTGWMALGAD
jgi:hypothetical protein